jgi:hypothetical protein
MKAYKGIFSPENPQKYKGNPTNIIYRSLWEKKMMIYLDKHPSVIYWQSEELIIPYRSPVDGRVHRYFPDFVVKAKNKKGVIETLVIEIKPKSQMSPPKSKNKKVLTEQTITYMINQAKWEAARKYCADRKYQFIVMNEDHLGIEYGK